MTDITMREGNDLRVIVSVVDQDGVPVDISGASEIQWSVADAVGDATTLLDKTLTGTDITITGTTGFYFDISAADSETTLGMGAYYHEALLTTGSGKAYTTLSGSLTIEEALISGV